MKLINTIFILLSCFFLNTSFASIYLGSTRVVISDGKNEGTVNVYNTDETNYLIQSWVINENEKPSDDFALTPPLFKLNSNNSNSLRIMLIKDLPQEKESLYFLNVKFIPSINKNDNSNKLSLAINNQIKLIYRPKSIANHDMPTEFKKVTLRLVGNQIELKNPTKHFINFSEIKADGKLLNLPKYVSPESSALVSLDGMKTVTKIEYTIIDDLGKLNLFEVRL